MQLKDIMAPSPPTIPRQIPVARAAMMMHEWACEALVVMDGRKPIGILTPLEITFGTVALGRNPNTTPASAVMRRDVPRLFEGSPLEDAAIAMRHKHSCHVLVTDYLDELVGIVSLAELAENAADYTVARTVRTLCEEKATEYPLERLAFGLPALQRANSLAG